MSGGYQFTCSACREVVHGADKAEAAAEFARHAEERHHAKIVLTVDGES